MFGWVAGIYFFKVEWVKVRKMNEVFLFLLSVRTYVFISIKPTSSHEGDFRAERIRNFDATYLCVPYGDFWCNLCTSKKLCEFLSKIVYLKWTLAICKTCQSITLQGDINFQLTPNSFLKYCYTIVFVHTISFSLLKDV